MPPRTALHFSHGLMRYHPPRQAQIPERDFDLYHNVVSAAYRFHDQMLGALLAKAGPDTHVILMSDHGFHPDHLRPRAIPHIPAGPPIASMPFWAEPGTWMRWPPRCSPISTASGRDRPTLPIETVRLDVR